MVELKICISHTHTAPLAYMISKNSLFNNFLCIKNLFLILTVYTFIGLKNKNVALYFYYGLFVVNLYL